MKRIYLILAVLFLAGCGSDSPVTKATNSVADGFNQTVGSVPHKNWGSYNLYQFQNGNWKQLVVLGLPTGPLPDLGPAPVMIVHGLGSSIRTQRFTPLAQALVANGASAVVGFEYDTLDSVATNGGYLTNAYNLLTETAPGRSWRHVGHSMGVLVSRVAFENGRQLNILPTGNKAVLVAGPNIGTPIANVIQREPDLFREALQYLVFHNQMDFTNSDFLRCDVTGQEQGFTDLREDGQFTTSLNIGAASKHPQWEYRTLAGDRRGADFEAIDSTLATFVDDGIVNTVSANSPVVGQVEFGTVGQDHSSIVESGPGLSAIVQFLR